MTQIKITLADGAQKEFDAGISLFEIAKSINKNLVKNSVCAKDKDGAILDMQDQIIKDTHIEFVDKNSEFYLEIIRHSTAHVLAFAVQKLWIGVKVTVGPVVKDGFYYDFDFPLGQKLVSADLVKIEQEMRRIIKKGFAFKKEIFTRAEVLERFNKINENYKVELINDIPEDEAISVYSIDTWSDLCRGPHVSSTAKLGAFKLTSIAGAYWRGNENNKMLTRVYGTAFKSKDDLKTHLERLEEAQKRDHRKLGKQLDLFSFHLESPANPFFHPKGSFLYRSLMQFMSHSNSEHGFAEINTPLIMSVDLWKQSGHYENYRENMYFVDIEGKESAVKPMNCPGHLLIYKTKRYSYKDLPIKFAEFGRVHRHERSGVVHGLFRVRSFIQDDAHIFCIKEQINNEIAAVLEQITEVYKALGFSKYFMELSTRPEKSIGSDEVWQHSESELKAVLDEKHYDYKLNPGDGAFYGPKIDIHLIDSLERSWQCATVQLDFSMPERFDLKYRDKDDNPQTPVMIHRAILGSLERFLGIFIEHTNGHFPLWIAPEQVRLINVSEKQEDYLNSVLEKLKTSGIRAVADTRNEKLGYKIREAQLQKIPYMLIIGDDEVSSAKVKARYWDGKQFEPQSVDEFVEMIRKESGELGKLL